MKNEEVLTKEQIQKIEDEIKQLVPIIEDCLCNLKSTSLFVMSKALTVFIMSSGLDFYYKRIKDIINKKEENE